MDANQFWLIVVEDSVVTVGLISRASLPFSVIAIGASQQWQGSEDSLVTAVDASLSDCATRSQLAEDMEPSVAALVIPPSWVGPDSRIVDPQHKQIETICKQLKLRPMGFISSEEAIVEEANAKEGIPASFISLHFSANTLTLSLVYLGKIKEFVSRDIDSTFTPGLVESALVDLHSQSALPPVIYVWGQVDPTILQSLQEYPWVGKKTVETFLHLPEITYRPITEMVRAFAHAIVFQIDPGSLPAPAPPSDLQPTIEDDPTPTPAPLPTITEVTPQEFGFGDIVEEQEDVTPAPIPEVENIAPPSPPRLPRIHLSLPQFHFHLPPIGIALIPIPIILLVSFLVLLLLSTAKITIFVTPFNLERSVPVTLSTTAQTIDTNGAKIPVTLKTSNISASESLPTTGKKTVGDRSKGEVIIFNKQEKVQPLPKGTVLVDSSGHKFELMATVQIASSSSDLNQGIITLGQIKTQVQAADIGPESNIVTNSKLTFKDVAFSQLIAKTNQTFAGGSRQEISAVSATDKQNLEAKINAKIKSELSRQMSQDVNQTQGLIADSIQIKKSRIDYNREVGEVADELSADSTATITALIFDKSNMSDLINGFLSTDPNYGQVVINPALFNASFKITKLGDLEASAIMTIKGTAQPKINSSDLQKLLPGKGIKFAQDLIRSKINRAYNIVIVTQPSFLHKIDILPLLTNHIQINIQSPSL